MAVAEWLLTIVEWPIALAVILHLLPVPYSVLACVGVWRSADRYAGKPEFARMAHGAVVAWFCFWFFF